MKNSIFDEINSSRYVLIVTHKNPDADTISCGLALSNYMYENKIKHKVFNNEKSLPNSLNFLNRFDKITHNTPEYYDLVIYVDCANKQRADIVLKEDIKVINIDHHKSNDNFADINIVDDKKASTAEVLYNLFEINDIKISKNTAICFYVGIYTDSIAFTTPRTDANTFKIVSKLLDIGIDVSYIADKLLRRDSLAKYRVIPKILNTLELINEGKIATIYLEDRWLNQTGATISECDEVVNMALNISIVEVVAYFRIIDNMIRVSLRSKGDIDVSKIANNFNGGGHKNAAGLSIKSVDIPSATIKVVSSIQRYIESQTPLV
ncbi:MAG: bifunctional oligoribonuclease/PAP phosphatase NrnA [Campylobacterota bacterium]|nr:bifunctional oligoribonuclease/PAP phosphatase NrnA [Campylobacterota bacterium]